MPPKALVDWESIPRDHVQLDRNAIDRILPHRNAMSQLDGVYSIDLEGRVACGFKEVRHDDFWADGHFPGMPTMPGVIMLEAAAQLSTVLHVLLCDETRILALAGIKESSFRGTVHPPGRLELVVSAVNPPSRIRALFHSQGFFDGKLVFDAKILGMPLAQERRALP